ncbi:MAG: 30S ribosomal protein S8e [Candidatus Woesearchaeota archaeon]|nr:30S ribosomal protein S8e [Candidatus Woesearchaeota archaeon]
MLTQTRPKRKETGGRYRLPMRAKRKFEMGRLPANTTIGEKKVRVIRTKFAGEKQKLLRTTKVNVLNPKTKKYAVADIKTVKENPANRHFVRRNIMTKGAIIETSIGKARVTSRPGQMGNVNAVLVE